MPKTNIRQLEASQRYYEKNKEQLRAKHREYSRQYRETHKDDGTRTRQYENRLLREKNAYIQQYMDDKDICDAFKTFLRQCVSPVVNELPLKFFKEFPHLAIVNCGHSVPNETTTTD